MQIDDPVETSLARIKESVDVETTSELGGATVAGLLSLIPGIGAAIQSLADGRAKENLEKRWLVLFSEFKTRIEEIRSSIPDEAFYGSEEFQSLLAVVLEQLATTHRKAKLKVLAGALANSGATPFQKHDKELYLRLIRDLSIEDIAAMQDSRLETTSDSEKMMELTTDEIARFSRLASMGLLIEQHATGFGGGPLPVGQDRQYQIAQLGKFLLQFISSGTLAN
jgi:hypothetical protein